MPSKKIIIHGVHRSGTSLTASLVEQMGAWYATPKQKMPSGGDNVRGFWERLDVVSVNDAILHDHGMSWNSLKAGLSQEEFKLSIDEYSKKINLIVKELNQHDAWFLKDPRFSFTWPIWSDVIQSQNLYHVVTTRHPLAVAKSLEKRNKIPLEMGLVFWANQSIEILRATSNEKQVCHMVFDGSKNGMEQNIDRINDFLCGSSDRVLMPLNKKDLSSIFDKDLVHQLGKDEQIESDFPEVLALWHSIKNQKIGDIDLDSTFEYSKTDWNLLDSTFSAKTLSSELSEVFNVRLSLASAELSQAQLELSQTQSELSQTQSELSQTRSELSQTRSELSQAKDQAKATYIDIASSLREFSNSKAYLLSKAMLLPVSFLKGRSPSAIDHMQKVLITSMQAEKEKISTINSYSQRERLVNAFFQNPMLFIRKLSLARVSQALKILFGRKDSDVNLEQVLTNYSVIPHLDKLNLEIASDLLALDDLEFPECSNPSVSIVIPVYNNYETTLSCLNSLKKNTSSKIRYEVIIADDCSTDETRSIKENATINVVKTKKNLGFLGNCNNACSRAKGEFIVLLNNDTNVQEGWLEALLNRIKSDTTIGVVGPMLLYPDGRLQEAGGIIFSDGSGWNYGRLDTPNKPEYQFSRKVDYISGACLFFRKSDWDSLGGFDPHFAPAYYEDTDLCFAMRSKGLTVDYVPTAKVVHFEGVSHGTDEQTGVKKYQAVNREKFLKKWNDQLQKDHYKDSSSLFLARHHGKSQKTVLIIDHYVPMYDKDAGSRSTYMYIKLFLEENIKVIFMGDNFYPHQPYTEHLQELGVEVLYGESYRKNWFDWLKQNVDFVDAIYLHRPHVTSKYIDQLRSLEKCPRLVYFGHDLHFLRLQREAELGMKNSSGKSIEKWKQVEFDIMKKADASLFPSDFEVDSIRKMDDSVNVDSIPLNWFPEKFSGKEPSIVSNPNLLFVGGFGHPPNIDGLNWFLDEVFPSILEKVPEAVLTIVGSRCPDEVFQLESRNINVLGEISDEELNKSYEQARVAIVPLRYGAGVKGKVLEAMAKGVPVLTTPVGAEGLPGINNAQEYLCVAEKAIDFSANGIELLRNDEKYNEQIRKAYLALDREFSRKAAKKIIKTLFD